MNYSGRMNVFEATLIEEKFNNTKQGRKDKWDAPVSDIRSIEWTASPTVERSVNDEDQSLEVQ